MPSVSVIIPSYNHALFLKQRIDSVLNQTFQDFEIIILDDCSTDGSKCIIDQYRGHSKISHIIYNTSNSGSPFKQWNKGLSLASGKYIWIAESDDVSLPTFLETMMNHVKSGHDLVYCRSSEIDEHGNVNDDYFWPDELYDKRWKTDYSESSRLEIRKCFIYRNTIPNASSCLFKKDNVVMNDFILSKKYCGDWCFWIQLLTVPQSKLYFVSQMLNQFRFHSGTSRGKKGREDEMLRLKEYWEAIRYARKTVSLRCVSFQERKRYNWIFLEIVNKRKVLGYYNTLCKSVPIGFIFYFYLFILGKLRTALIKKFTLR